MGLNFHIDVAAALMDRDGFIGTELAGTDQAFRLEFPWLDRSDLAVIDVRPAAIRAPLADPVTPVVRHIVNHG